VAFIGFLALALTGCAEETTSSQRTVTQTAPPPEHGPAVFVHVVFFDAKPDTPDAVLDEMVADAHRILGKIPSVRTIASGRRDARMQRDLNDTDFTVGLVIHFDDKAGHDLYNDHELHQQYVAKYKDYFAKVRVFDFTAPAR
jgi:hypothetical protein